ncbi:hypothetical protein HZP25_15670 [Elizabethkingia anophelis]|nr:hypothetical protein [Elizabethkingia anophelis]
MHIIKKYTGVFLLLINILFSCNSTDKKRYYESFDLPLLKKSDEYRLSGNYKEYIALQNKYYKIANDKGYEDGKALCYLQMCSINQLLMNYDKSLYFLKKADSVLSKSNDEAHKALLYRDYAAQNLELKLLDNSLYYSDKVLASIKNVDHKEMKEILQLGAYQKRAVMFGHKRQYDSVYTYLTKAQKIRKDFFTESLFIALYAGQNKLDSLVLHLNKVQGILMNGKEISPSHLFVGHLSMGAYYTHLKRFTEAEKEFDKAQELLSKFKNTFSTQVFMYQGLASFYREKGDIRKSDHYMYLYSVEKRKLDKEIQSSINPAVNKFISDTNEIEVKSHRRMWIVISALGILCILIAVFAYRQLSIQKQKKKMLKEKANVLKGAIGDQRYDEMIILAKRNNPAFLDKFQEIYPDFVSKLHKINPELENSELAFAALIKLNFTAKEIASYTFIQHASVQQRKRRLRKRLYLSGEVDLYQFFNVL